MREEIKKLCQFIENNSKNFKINHIDLSNSNTLSNEDLKALLFAIQKNKYIKEIKFPTEFRENILCQTIKEQIKINQENANKKPTKITSKIPLFTQNNNSFFPKNRIKNSQTTTHQRQEEYSNSFNFLFIFLTLMIVLYYGAKIASHFLKSLKEDISENYYKEILQILETHPNKNKKEVLRTMGNKIEIFPPLLAFPKLNFNLGKENKKLMVWSKQTKQCLEELSKEDRDKIMNEVEELIKKYNPNKKPTFKL